MNPRKLQNPLIRALTSTLLGLTLLFPTPLLAAEPASAEAQQIYAIGDVHGAYGSLVALLEALQLIDAEQHWSGGTAQLVSLGDLLDRGSASRKVLDLLMRLEQEAPQHGGRVVVVTGNHEIMNLTGDLRYVADGEYAAFANQEPEGVRDAATGSSATGSSAGEGAAAGSGAEASSAAEFPPGFFGHRAAFARSGTYGRWLLDKPAIAVIGDSAFMHGGLPAWLHDMTVNAYNRQFQQELERLLEAGNGLISAGVLPPWDDLLTANPLVAEHGSLEPFLNQRQSRLFGDDSVHWYRGNASCHWAIERERLTRALGRLGVQRVVLGHTPTRTRRIAMRFDGAVILADTGMLEPYYRGIPAAVLIEPGGVTAYHLINGRLESTGEIGAAWVDQSIAARGELESRLRALEPGELERDKLWSAGGRSWRVSAVVGSRKARNRQLAAYRLDRMLDLGLVPVTVEATGQQVLKALPGSTFTETERYAEGRYRPNPCGATGDYQLMYAWDMLIGNNQRTGDQISYDSSDFSLVLDGHEAAFRTSTAVPEYLAGRDRILPAGLARRLAQLDAATLEQNLGQWLESRALKAINARREVMLSTWTIDPAVEELTP